MTHAVAEIRWLSPTEGGRQAAVTARRYMAPAVTDAPGDPWTLVVDRSTADPQTAETVLVHFLMPSAPHHDLAPGRTFRLFEGGQTVAAGTVSEVFA